MLTFSAGVLFFGIETVGRFQLKPHQPQKQNWFLFKASATSDTLSTVVGTLPDTSSNVIVVV